MEKGQKELGIGPGIRSAVFISVSEVQDLFRLLILLRGAGSWLRQASDVEEGTRPC